MDLETLLGELREPQPDPATESDGVHPACFSIEAGHHAISTAVHTNPLSQCRHSRNFLPNSRHRSFQYKKFLDILRTRMKFCSPEIHSFCLCKTDDSLAAFLQVERAGTSRDGVAHRDIRARNPIYIQVCRE